MRVQFAYHWHTTRRLITCAAKLSDADYHRQPGYGHGSVHDLLFHVLRTDWAWRVALETGKQTAPIQAGEYTTLEALRAGFAQEEVAWERLLAPLTDDQLEEPLQLINWRGDSMTFIRWRVLQHLVLHGMQHHTEIAQLLTAKSQSPGDLDFVFYQG